MKALSLSSGLIAILSVLANSSLSFFGSIWYAILTFIVGYSLFWSNPNPNPDDHLCFILVIGIFMSPM